MRSKALRRIQFALAITIAFFSVAAIGISFAIVERQTALREVSRYNITWAASQAIAELQRFENEVAIFGLPGGGVTKDDVELRLDILFNRASILRTGDFIPFAAAHPEQKAFIEEFAAALPELEALVAAIDQAGVVMQILDRTAELGTKLTRVAAAANQYSGRQAADDQRHLLELHWAFSAIAAGLVLCGLIFIGLLFSQNRVVQQAHDDLRRITD